MLNGFIVADLDDISKLSSPAYNLYMLLSEKDNGKNELLKMKIDMYSIIDKHIHFKDFKKFVLRKAINELKDTKYANIEILKTDFSTPTLINIECKMNRK